MNANVLNVSKMFQKSAYSILISGKRHQYCQGQTDFKIAKSTKWRST